MDNKIALARNLTLNTLTSYVETALGLLSGIMIARVLGPHDYGIYAFSVWLCGMVIYACNSSLTTSSVKFIAEARGTGSVEVASAVAHRFRRMQAVWSTLCIVAFGIGVALVMPKEWRSYGWLLPVVAVVAIWSRAGFRMLSTIGEGFEKYEPENYTVIIAAVVNVTAIGLLALAGASFERYFILYAAMGLLMTALVRRYLKTHAVPLVRGAIPSDFRLRMRRHVLITGVFVTLGLLSGRFFEMTLLKMHWTVVEVGYFAIASTLTRGAIELLASGLTAVLMPAMARYFGKGGMSSLARVFDESMRVYWFIGLLLAGLALVVTDGMIHVLYGRQYVDAVPIILVSLVVTGLTCFNGASAAALTAADRQLDRVYIAIVSIAINGVVAWLLVPRYGLAGAAVSLVVVRLFETAASHICAARRLGTRLQRVTFLRLGAAGLVAGLVAVPAAVLPEWRFAFIPAAVLFVLLYLGSTVAFRAWRPDDIDFGVAMLRKVTPGWPRFHRRLSVFQDVYERRCSC